MSILEALKPENIEITEMEPLAPYCTYQFGGPADFMAKPKTALELQRLILACKSENTPFTIIGKGSNLLISDRGVRGMVIIISDAFSKIGFLPAEPGSGDYLQALQDLQSAPAVDSNGFVWLMAEAGASFIKTSQYACEHGTTGLEFACGIPGSVGGASYMNAGAYDGTSADVAARTYYMDKDGTICSVTWEEHEFAYRKSRFQKAGDIVLATVYRLRMGEQEAINTKVADLTQRRENSQPLELPSCGSVFKRPEGHFAGKLIMDAGLQGYRIGGAEVSKKHAGFIVNVGGACARDVADLIKHIQKTIEEQYHVRMETEVRYIGEWEEWTY